MEWLSMIDKAIQELKFLTQSFSRFQPTEEI